MPKHGNRTALKAFLVRYYLFEMRFNSACGQWLTKSHRHRTTEHDALQREGARHMLQNSPNEPTECWCQRKSAAVPRICRWDQPWSSWADNGMPLSSRSLSTPTQLHSITNVSCTYSEAGTGLKDTAYRMKMYSAAQPPWTAASSLENMTTTCQAELLWTNHIHTNGHI